jgi:serine phosphatase RsbU (regulator of sigma subunit)
LVIATALFIFKNYSEKKKLSHSLAEKNQEITDSINYAKRIQEAILPSTQLLSDYFSDHFVFYKPKDIVSGDFYWIAETNEKIIFTAVDCTGHGVPGAFMSFIGYSLLNQIVKENKITQPAEILKILSKRIKQNLQQQNITSSVKDAMDIALCSYDKKNKTLEYSGAYNPLYYFRNSQFYDIKPDKIAIGNFSEQTKYTHHKMEVQENDILYIFSDGYADQFGGQKQKKFSYKQFREVLFTIHKKPMTEQQKILQDTFVSWKKHNEQTDDVLIVGIKI